MALLGLDEIAEAYPDFPAKVFAREGIVMDDGQTRRYMREFNARIEPEYEWSIRGIPPTMSKPFTPIGSACFALVLRQEQQVGYEPYRTWVVGSEFSFTRKQARVYGIHAPKNVSNQYVRKQLREFDPGGFMLLYTIGQLGAWGVEKIRIDHPSRREYPEELRQQVLSQARTLELRTEYDRDDGDFIVELYS